jgi:very-short-patch-repair endonuclease
VPNHRRAGALSVASAAALFSDLRKTGQLGARARLTGSPLQGPPHLSVRALCFNALVFWGEVAVQGDPESQCLQLAARQDGVIRRDQALKLGFTPRQIDWRLSSRRWVVVFPGVYRVQGAKEDWRHRLRALCLWAGRDYALSHRCAATLWGAARFRREILEISLVRGMRIPPGVIAHRADALPACDLRWLQALRVTSPERTVVDLCLVASSEDVIATADEFLRRKRVSLNALQSVISRHSGRTHVRILQDLLARYRAGECPTESELESRALDIIRAAGLPLPTKQVPVLVAGRLARLDFFYPDRGLVIEADSYEHHSDPVAFERDRARRNALAARGLQVLQWTWRAICDQPDQLCEELRQTLLHPPHLMWSMQQDSP